MTLLTDFAAIKEKAIKAVIPPEQNNLSADELELKNEAQQIASKEADLFDAFLQVKHEELNAISAKNTQLNQELDKTGLISSTMNQAEVLATVGSHVQKDLETREPAIAAKVKLMEAETIWKRFRAEHNLMHREAKDKISVKRLFAPIVLILLFEVLMYSNFYRDDNGLIGGFTNALAIAFLSLVIQIALGYSFRYHNIT